jgi:hypothetical protein
MTIRSKHRRAFRKNAGGSRGGGRSRSKGSKSKGQSKSAAAENPAAVVLARQTYVPTPPEPVTSSELILIFIGEFIYYSWFLEAVRVNEIREKYFLPWYKDCTPEQKKYWEILWGNPNMDLFTQGKELMAVNDLFLDNKARGVLQYNKKVISLLVLVMFFFWPRVLKGGGLIKGVSNTDNSNYFGGDLEKWIKDNGNITINNLLTGLEENIDEMKKENIDEMKEKKIDEMKEKLKAIKALDGADEVLNKTIKDVADENKAVLREYLAKHKSPSPPRASSKTAADKNLHRRMRGRMTRKKPYTPGVRTQ